MAGGDGEVARSNRATPTRILADGTERRWVRRKQSFRKTRSGLFSPLRASSNWSRQAQLGLGKLSFPTNQIDNVTSLNYSENNETATYSASSIKYQVSGIQKRIYSY
ncbi:MAG: hypothetical protein A2Z11_00725 [Candidatus Woykebacteria bacterium RBG_16_43_9]|uniref:Uncharacterized protein n=1 Tax=Candidatus Woykebacteria bacterium RBG_16_43_9 TaxID=1802596 RepID=A0A1G1WDK3_9BACT|nr:MAG: hypothetical protein A2Z11_00725 [Candidatus Woykebacteria bacterium RBG_16_43_9]